MIINLVGCWLLKDGNETNLECERLSTFQVKSLITIDALSQSYPILSVAASASISNLSLLLAFHCT